jgi:hypothetical protein
MTMHGRHWLASTVLGVALLSSAGVAGCTTRGGDDPVDAGTFDAPIIIAVDSGPDARPACAAGEIDCFGTCTRVVGDSLNCGSCGNVCPAGVTCALGVCDCEAPMLACDGVCLDPSSDVEHCGDCDTVCKGSEMCTDGECILLCEAPDEICTSQVDGAEVRICADLQTDPMNCGRCNARCAGGANCDAGRCACPTGQLNCDGRCTDISTDPTNCGACRITCGEGGVCEDSACTTCGTGRTACSGRCVDVMTDRFNCGMCARGCGSGEACAGGLCECAVGLTDCGTGCTDLLTNPDYCGDCATDCGAGGVCTAGACTCASGLTMCGTSCHDTDTDLAHCGGCDMPCPALVGGVCAGGVCGCPAGMTDCAGTCVSTQTSIAHCGMCGMACPAGEVCVMGGCTDAPLVRYMQTAPTAAMVPFIDACAVAGHTAILSGVDDGSARVPLPFPFRYWATDLPAGAMINVTSNGWMGMNGVASASLGGSVPTTSTPNAVIAPHWGDNYTRGPICIATVGTAPNRQWVVQWNDTHYCCTPGTTHLTYEVILSEGSGLIDFAYQTMDGARSQTMGIENQTGMMGINACPGGTGGCTPTAGQRVRFVPIP